MWDSKDFAAKSHEKIWNFQPWFSRQKIQLEINKEKKTEEFKSNLYQIFSGIHCRKLLMIVTKIRLNLKKKP